MDCLRCGCSQSDVLETRTWRGAFTRRKRRCFNGHVFFTIEVPPSLVRKHEVQTTLKGIAERASIWKRKEAVRADEGRTKTQTLARRLQLSTSRVRALRREIKNER